MSDPEKFDKLVADSIARLERVRPTESMMELASAVQRLSDVVFAQGRTLRMIEIESTGPSPSLMVQTISGEVWVRYDYPGRLV